MFRKLFVVTGLGLMVAGSTGIVITEPHKPQSWLIVGMTLISFVMFMVPEKEDSDDAEDW